ncbi:MAG: translation initiation factor IF-2 [Bacteroidales bacterium]|nr:translation initiation factor IF-2 [Bacteroidales bacterium]
MAERKATRLSKAAREFNVGISTIVEFLGKKGHEIDSNPNSKLDPDLYELLQEEYSTDLNVKKESEKLTLKNLRERQESLSLDDVPEAAEQEESEELIITDHTTSSADTAEPAVKKEVPVSKEEPKPEKEKPVVEEKVETPKAPKEKAPKEKEPKEKEPKEKVETPKAEKSTEPSEKEVEPEVVEGGPRVVGKIDLDSMNQKTRPSKKSKAKSEDTESKEAEKAEKTEKAETETKAKTAAKEKAEKDIVKKTEKVETKDTSEAQAEEVKPEPIEAPPETSAKVEEKITKKEKEEESNLIPTRVVKLTGPTVVGKIELPKKREPKKKPVASSKDDQNLDQKKKRKRIKKETGPVDIDRQKAGAARDKGGKRKKRGARPEVNEEDVQKQIKDTLAKLTSKGSKSKTSKYRREKRDAVQAKLQEESDQMEQRLNVLQVTEFVSVNELANMMDVPPTQVIQTCMNLGLFVSINQRLDAETMALVADEFKFKVEFVSVDLVASIQDEEDAPEDLLPRSPIVTVMGHVDHGKTKLLDVVRDANVVEGEAGGITQHIGAYSVKLEDGRKITFLDTPGHEAFTAMRARVAKITDVAIIVVAADDGVKPQTVEALNHAAAAGVPIVFAMNKIDLPAANPEKIKDELAQMNYMTEDWGGKYQSQEISAKGNVNIEELLDKVLLEAELLDLKANPEKAARGTIIESTLDKGRGNIATILVESGTLKIGDVVLAGQHFGHVKAMFNERGKKVSIAGPSTPALILGLNGAPQAGESFNVMSTDKEAKEIANKREQLQREQELRTTKHITLDEIGRRIAIGNFQELNVIVKGDVDGSIEALSDSLIKLSTEEIQVNIKHKAVGQISESDILLAAASNAIVIGFQVRPSLSARKLAEKEQIDIRLYSIIYDAIEELKAAMEGMLTPEIKEDIIGTLEIQEVFKITKVGTIAGCMVREGKIKRTSKVRLIRDGIVIYSGELGSLKRFKDEAKEVVSGLECGLNIENFNDIKVGDMVEAYEETELKKTL